MRENGLRTLQSWMQDVIRHPAGAAAAPGSVVAADLVASSGALDAVDRLHIYNRGYHARLLECLAAAYPVLRRTTGAELFEAFALDYLGSRPSQSYTLRSVTEGFAAYLESSRPDPDASETWVELLLDVARVEQTFAEVFDGPGSEGTADVPFVEPRPRANARVRMAPAFRLVDVSFDVGAYFLAHRRGEDADLPRPRAGALAFTRRDFVVSLTRIDPAQRGLLGGLIDGATVAEAAANAGIDLVTAWRWVGEWAERSFFAAVEGGPEGPR